MLFIVLISSSLQSFTGYDFSTRSIHSPFQELLFIHLTLLMAVKNLLQTATEPNRTVTTCCLPAACFCRVLYVNKYIIKHAPSGTGRGQQYQRAKKTPKFEPRFCRVHLPAFSIVYFDPRRLLHQPKQSQKIRDPKAKAKRKINHFP